MRKLGKRTIAVVIASALGLTASACSSSGGSTPVSATTSANSTCKSAGQSSTVTALPGFQVCLFAASTTKYNHPDNILVSGSNVIVGYQNITAKDGTDNKTSTIVEFSSDGTLQKQWTVGGHTDGMRVDPTSKLLWVMSNEDGSPRLFTIDTTSTAAAVGYTLDATPHGGGFDDVQFLGGLALIDASNPTLDANGNNVFPALYSVTLSGTKAHLTKLLMANASATTIATPSKTVTLNLTDPDSMMITPQGDLMLDSQADGEILFIHNVGTAQQTVKVLSVGTQVDDSVFVTSSKGCMLITDNASGVYSVCSSLWVSGTAYTAAPNDSTIIGFVGNLNLSSGVITPMIVGLGNPHGLAFLAQ